MKEQSLEIKVSFYFSDTMLVTSGSIVQEICKTVKTLLEE